MVAASRHFGLYIQPMAATKHAGSLLVRHGEAILQVPLPLRGRAASGVLSMRFVRTPRWGIRRKAPVGCSPSAGDPTNTPPHSSCFCYKSKSRRVLPSADLASGVSCTGEIALPFDEPYERPSVCYTATPRREYFSSCIPGRSFGSCGGVLRKTSVVVSHEGRFPKGVQIRYVRTGFFRSDPDFIDPEDALVRLVLCRLLLMLLMWGKPPKILWGGLSFVPAVSSCAYVFLSCSSRSPQRNGATQTAPGRLMRQS